MRFLTLLFVLLVAGVAGAQDSTPAELRDVGVTQRLDEPLPLDLTFRDEAGERVQLGDYFGDRPVLLSLVYYECPMLCTLVLNGLLRALRALAFDVGEEFEVLTVSFDPRETPSLAAAKKENYVAEYGRPDAARGWHFLTGEEAAIETLTRSVGFRYRYDEEKQQYAHAAAIVVITPQGKIARYFYGVEYSPRDLRFALIEASEERIGSPVDQLLLYCYQYDPTTGRYSAAVMNIIRVGGVLTVLAVAAFVLRSARRERRKSKMPPPAGRAAEEGR
jgi:protein SCO1/2